MAKQLFEIGTGIFTYPVGEFDLIIHDILSFFLFFEFFTMILRYLQEDHHIPIRYLIYICITAILRHEIGNPTDALDTLLVAIAIFILVCTLVIIQLNTGNTSIFTPKRPDEHSDNDL